MSTTEKQETAVAIRMQDLSPQYAEIMVLGNVLQKSGYFKDVRDQAQAVTKILCGRELGFSPIVSMQGIHIIEGKPALSSNLMATLIKRSGKYDYRVKSWTNTECVLTFREKADVSGGWENVGESSFTIDDAKAAGVLRAGGSWSKYPKAMLFARALSQGLRTYCPDVSAAPIYNPEEMGAEVNEDGDVMSVRDLPKSSRPVEVIEQDIVIEPPKSAAANSGQGVQSGTLQKETPQAAVPLQPLPPLDDLVQQAEAAMGIKPASLPGDCVDVGQAANFHIEFKKALPAKLRKDSEAIAHDWLKLQKIVDGDGNGTAKAIRKGSFLDVRTAAIEYAKTYQA